MDVLLSKEHAARRSEQIDPDRASFDVRAASLAPAGTDTSYFCVVDGDGNAVSFIHSLYQGFGSGFVAEGTGVVFNGRQRGFRLEEGHPQHGGAGEAAHAHAERVHGAEGRRAVHCGRHAGR